MPVCIHPCEHVLEGDKAEEESWRKQKGRWLLISFWKSLLQQYVFPGFYQSAVHGLHKDDGGGVEHRRNASQRAASFHIPKNSLVSICSIWCTVSGYVLLRAATQAHAWLWKIHFVLLEPSRTIINRMKTKPSRQRFSGCPSQAHQCQLPWDFTFTWRKACLIMRH